MPPLEWSIVQSLLLNLVMPGVVAAIGIHSIACALTTSERLRAVAASVAFLSSIVVVNARNDLVPILAIKPIVADSQSLASDNKIAASFPWEFERGWYSLVSVTLIAVFFETVLDLWFEKKTHRILVSMIRITIGYLLSIWALPRELVASIPWTGLLMALVVLGNTWLLRSMGQSRYAFAVPLVTAVLWGGCATLLAVLSHSARFADLAMMLSCALAAVGISVCYSRQKLTSLSAGPALFIPGLMLETWRNTYSDIPAITFTCVALAPLTLGFSLLPKLRGWFAARPFALALLPAIPCAIAIVSAVRAEVWK